MSTINCPKCNSNKSVKCGIIKEKQRFKCKDCGYHFTVNKIGKSIESYYVIKALQLYMEGLSYREIERILGVSHVSVINWVKKYKAKIPEAAQYQPSYKVMSKAEMAEAFMDSGFLKNSSMLVSELGDKLMVIKWRRKE